MGCRELIVDTETTGLDPENGDRIVEIAAIELIDRSLTSNIFHRYVNPCRDIPDSAFRVHGLSSEFLSDKERFEEIIDEFLLFIGNDQLIAHNAEFDLRFINAELKRSFRSPLDRGRFIDTLVLARRKHPGVSNSLDSLCARYGIDRSRRTNHGALIDSEILAEVYVELTGGRQTSLSFPARANPPKIEGRIGRKNWIQRQNSLLSVADVGKHEEFVGTLNDRPLWRRYGSSADS